MITGHSVLKPPSHVAYLKTFSEDAFVKKVEVPFLTVHGKSIPKISPLLKPLHLSLRNLPPIQACQHDLSFRDILLDPERIKTWNDLEEPLRKLLIKECNVSDLKTKEIEIRLENYQVRELIEAIFPEPEKRISSWTFVGHILHVNLTEDKIENKELVGQLLLKIHPTIKMVVNKVNSIDSEFRNFEMEILAQTPEGQKCGTIVEVKENKCNFKLDFAKVYWNSRLNSEHSRIINTLHEGDIVYDLFAGIGPFAIPAAKKKCQVLANDLNPDATHWLEINAKSNKVQSTLKIYNMDARDFVRKELKSHLLDSWKQQSDMEVPPLKSYYILMNLPGMAIEFLDSFKQLFDCMMDERLLEYAKMPIIHCYTFLRKDLDAKEIIPKKVEQIIDHKLPDDYELDIVRDVAPNKHMFRISFAIPAQVLFSTRQIKKQKVI